jgi:hypothetical protein
MFAVCGTNATGAVCELAHPVKTVTAKTTAAQQAIIFFENVMFYSPSFIWSISNLSPVSVFVNLIHY